METKKITLRSQTVQCPHCGEYYSVTYKYCPFCDAGRKEEERRQAAKRQKTKDFFGNLFGSHASEKPEGEAEPASEEDLGPELLDAVLPKKRAPKPTPHQRKGKAKAKSHTTREAAHTKEPSRRRKKTSEMTEEEKAADRAEREARAAARKRERDRKAREAALAAAETVEAGETPAQEKAPVQVEMAPGGSGPVFDEVTVPESFGYDEAPQVEADPAVATQVVVDGTVVEGTMPPETRAFSPENQAAAPAQKEAPAQKAAPAKPAQPTEWDTLKDLGALAGPSAAPEIPDPIPAPAAEVQVNGQTVEGGAQGAQEAPPADDLDALLREVRGLLADSPVPLLTKEQMEKPAAPVEEVAIQETAPAQEAAPAQETEAAPAEAPVPEMASIPEVEAAVETPQGTVPVEGTAPVQEAEPAQEAAPAQAARAEFDVEEPTIHIGEIPTDTLWLGDGGDKPAAENYAADLVDDRPTQEIPIEEISQAVQAQQAAQEASAQEAEASLEEGAEAPEKAPAQEEELLAAVRPPKAPAEKKPEARRSSRKKKKSGPNPVLIVVSLAIVVAAIFIVMRVVVPAFQTGIFSSGEPAESLTLDMSQLDLAEAGTTMNLVPTFSPEGSTGTLTWTSSDEAVATVDDQGNVTAVAPGNATITATLENGQSATCNVTCTWDSQGTEDLGEGAPAEEAPAEEAPAEETPAGPALSSNDITLDAAGDSQQLTLTGGEGEVTWASGDKAVATVDDQGNVTAVAPGRTTVTATVGEQTLKCEVRCIW